MGIHKHNSIKNIGTPPSSKSSMNDYVQEVLWFGLGLQALFLAGVYWKNPLLTSTPVFLAQLFAPAIIVAIANTWRRAFKYALLSSFVIPIAVGLILVLVAIVSFVSKPSMGGLLKYVIMSVKTSFVVWIAALSVSLPSIVIGVVARFAWSKLRLRSR